MWRSGSSERGHPDFQRPTRLKRQDSGAVLIHCTPANPSLRNIMALAQVLDVGLDDSADEKLIAKLSDVLTYDEAADYLKTEHVLRRIARALRLE